MYLYSIGDSVPDDARLRLPRPQSDRRDVGSGVQFKETNRFRHCKLNKMDQVEMQDVYEIVKGQRGIKSTAWSFVTWNI